MRRKGLIIFISISVFLVVSFISVDEITHRIQLKEAFFDGVFPERDPSQYQVKRIHYSLNIPWFTIRINRIPETRDYLAIEKGGTVTKFSWDDIDETRVVLDMKDIVMAKGESGMLDVAFHPQFHNESSEHYREIYLAYNYAFDPVDEQRNFLRLSRFYFSEDLNTINRTSEEILIQQFSSNPNHNAAKLFFDGEEYLYFTIGDEGGAYDLYRNGQLLDRELFSGIIRIDINNDSSRSHPIRRQPARSFGVPAGYPENFTRNYMIPNDNPWVDASGRYLEEFYAIGLRNPFTATLDREGGGIWVGDVGQEGQEEITFMTKGTNGQWPYMEGRIRHQETPENLLGIEAIPAVTYGRGDGKSVICGYVYQGEIHAELKNTLIYGDFITGNIWSYDPERDESKVLSGSGKQVLQFFEGPDDEIYFLALGGEIYQLEAPVPSDIPMLLSETGVFDDLSTLTPTQGIVPYEINTPLWSDGAEKQRWVSVPNDRLVGYEKNDQWIFRSGTVFIKHFEMEMGGGVTRRLETRFLIKDSRGRAYGISYKWNESGTDANLIPAVETPVDTLEFLDGTRRAWNYPSRSQCLQCHTEQSDFVLGVKTAQLNRPITWNGEHHENQVILWEEIGLFTETHDFSSMPKMSAISDTAASSLNRFKSYLDANCSGCHQPEAVAPQFDARFSTPIEMQDLIYNDTDGFNSIETNHIITPGNPNSSELFRRDAEEEASWRMPPLARNMVDGEYIEFLREFIKELGAPTDYIKDTVCVGDTYFFQDSTYIVLEEDFHDSIRYTGSLGIDSLVIYDLKVLPADTVMVFGEVCHGGSYLFPSGELMRDLTQIVIDSSWVISGGACSLVITEINVLDEVCEILPLEITLGPNPIDRNYFILSSNIDIEEITLIDFSGKLVDIQEVLISGDRIYRVNLVTNTKNGLYLVKVQSGGQIQSRKVMLNR